MNSKKITVIDETIREGMQYRGVVFSKKQREKIVDFQEQLGVDISQVGYAPAHITEQENISYLNNIVQKRGYKIRVAAMGRASINDVDILIKTGVSDFHLHAHIKSDNKSLNYNQKQNYIEESLEKIGQAVFNIRNHFANSKPIRIAKISIAVLDIGKSSPHLLDMVSKFFTNKICIDILSLPDTSGIMSPISFYDAVFGITSKIKFQNTCISVHCHNDLGMASANTIMGVKAGATVVELSALGIGERNGIGDIFTVGKILKSEGYKLNLDTNNIKTFKEYYQYVSNICKEQTGRPLINYTTPFFGDGVRTHVAGTHGSGSGFGLFLNRVSCENIIDSTTNGSLQETNIKLSLVSDKNYSDEQQEAYYLNVLCGKELVKKYLELNLIPYNPAKLNSITEKIKAKSAELGRSLEKNEIIVLLC